MKTIKRVCKVIYYETNMLRASLLWITVVTLIIVLLSSCICSGPGGEHIHCLPGCEETYIDSLDNHDYDPEGVWGQEIHNK